MTVEEHWVKPRSADNYENVLSELTKEELGLSEEQIRKGNSLEDVISKVPTSPIFRYLLQPQRPIQQLNLYLTLNNLVLYIIVNYIL